MRKATIRRGDVTLETELSDSQIDSFLGISSPQSETESLPSQTKRPTTLDDVLKHRPRRSKGYDAPEWKVIADFDADLRGRESKRHYSLRHNEVDHRLVGLIRNSRGSLLSRIWLGRTDDPNSKIGQMIKSVNTMPIDKPFTRKELLEILPSTLSAGNVLKFSLRYLTEAGILKRLKEREIATGAIRYVRMENVSGSSNKLVTKPPEPQSDYSNGGVTDVHVGERHV